MAQFSYKGRTKDGRLISGQISSSSKVGARNALYNRGIRPLKVAAIVDASEAPQGGKHRFIYRDKNGAIQIQLTRQLPSLKELAVFSKQFSLMIENGVPLLQSLNLLKSQQRRQVFAEIIDQIAKAVEKGASLSDAMEPHAGIFDSLYVSLVRAGEASGRLDVIFRQLVVYIEKAVKIRAQVKSAMNYPVIIVVVAVAVVSLLLTFVVPTFAKQFQENGQKLPQLTQFVIDMSDFMMGNIGGILGGMIAFVLGIRFYIKRPEGRRVFDTYILKAPLIGEILTKIAIGRFCGTMSTMLSSGVAILEALTICAAAAGNKRIEEMVIKIRDAISEGQTFAAPLEESGIFPKMVSSMVAVGEATGTLDVTLAKITDIYDDEVETSINAMTAMIEPLMIVVIGGLVGFIVIAMYLPVFDMAGTIGGE